MGSKDKKKNVYENLKIVRKKINKKAKRIFLVHQIHSNKFVYINKNFKIPKKKIKADAIITDQKKIPIAILTADCVPLLVYDKKKEWLLQFMRGGKVHLKTSLKKF